MLHLVGAAVRAGRRPDRVRHLLSRRAAARVALFAMFYALGVLLTAGSPFDGQSDTTATVTIETVKRAARARLLLEEGSASYSPMVFLLAWFSLFFGRDPLAAAVPLQLAIYAACAVLAAEIGRAAFGVSIRAAAPIVTRLRFVTEADVRLSAALIGYAAIALVVGTLVADASAARPVENVSGPWQGFAAIRGHRFSDVTIQLRKVTDLDRALAGYYFPRARLTFVDFKAGAQPPLDAISERTPLFIQHLNCGDVGHDDVVAVPRFGCLLLNAPAATLDAAYPFSRRFLFITHTGMTPREPGGRWNVGSDMEWRVAADPARGALDRELFLNVSVNPFLPERVPPHRVRFIFRNGDAAEIPIATEAHLSVPVRTDDWTVSRVWMLPVRVHFPDGRTMLFHQLSVTAKPRGVVVRRTSAATQG